MLFVFSHDVPCRCHPTNAYTHDKKLESANSRKPTTATISLYNLKNF